MRFVAPKISICLPTLNSREFLPQRMESILAQTESDWELIVCDSYSNDGTWEYLQTYRDDHRVRLFQIPADGLYAGWNQCLARVRGKYFYFATSDDTMQPKLLARLSAALEAQPDVMVATCNFDFIDQKDAVIPPTQGIAGSFLGEWADRPHRRSGMVDFLIHSEISISWTTMTSALFRRDILDVIGLFRVDASFSADRFWAVALSLHSDTVHLPEHLATWRIHDRQSSSLPPPGWRKRNVELMEETLQNHWPRVASMLPGLPQEMLMDHLLSGVRRYFEESFCLDRMHLKRRPRQFITGAVRSLFGCPGLLWRRLKTGFAWEPEVEDQTRELMRSWSIPWPPDPIEVTEVASDSDRHASKLETKR